MPLLKCYVIFESSPRRIERTLKLSRMKIHISSDSTNRMRVFGLTA